VTTPRADRDHPLDELAPYLLGELDPIARAAVDGHLDRCASCRAELARLSDGFVAAVEALPPTPPSDGVWDAIAGRVAAERQHVPVAAPHRAPEASAATPGAARGRSRRAAGPHRPAWAAGGLVASLALAAVLGVWGASQRQVALDLRAELAAARAVAASRATERAQEIAALEALVGALADEQAHVARWLSDADVAIATIAGDGGALGAVLYRVDGAALVVMRDAPGPGRSLQAWGVADGAVTSLGAFEGRVLEVSSEGFEAVAISLEPLGGSATPTEVLGAAPRS
jgi:hypothetical protein